jgi:hypothetical protein
MLGPDSHLDFETLNVYTLEITVSDKGRLRSSANVVVHVVDVQEPPVMQPQLIKAMERSEPGTNVKYLDRAVDEDKNDITYSIVGGSSTAGGDVTQTFFVHATLAYIEVKATTAMLIINDVNNPPVTVLTVRATDSTGLYDEAEVTVKVVDNNFKPVFKESTMYMVVRENSKIGTVVCFKSAPDYSRCTSALENVCTDVDEDDTLSYSVSSSPSSTIAFSSLFALDKATGQISVASEAIDFEAGSKYVFYATATDDHPDAPMEATSTLVIQVLDVNEAPLVEGKVYPIPEFPLVPSSIVKPFKAEDVDAADKGQLRYSIVSVTPNMFAGAFSIDATTGDLAVADAKRELFDFESVQDDIELSIQVSDASSLSSTLTLTLPLRNVNEEPSIRALSVSVLESILPGDVVGTLVASDSDSGTQLHYRLLGPDSRFFNVDSTGQVTLDDGKALDFESKSSLRVIVEMEDELLLEEPHSMLPIVRGKVQSKFRVSSEMFVEVQDINDVVIHSMKPSTLLQTKGDEVVTIVGENFGTLYSPADVSVTYSNGKFSFTPECTLPQYNDSNTEIECVTVEGQGGVDYVWTVSIGGSPYTVPGVADSRLAFRTSFARPTIASVVSPPSSTAGGEQVHIRGENFGAMGADVVVLYGDKAISEQYWYKARNCTIAEAHTSIACMTAAGVGDELYWIVKVEGQASPQSLNSTRYLAPTLHTALILDSNEKAADLLKTRGNEWVRLSGENFGPRGSQVIASYGPSHDKERYTTTRCEVTVDHVEVSCESVPGVGAHLIWKVVVSGQPSDDSLFTVSYEPPSVTLVSGPGAEKANTDGGQIVYIDGDNFGPICTSGKHLCCLHCLCGQIVLRFEV